MHHDDAASRVIIYSHEGSRKRLTCKNVASRVSRGILVGNLAEFVVFLDIDTFRPEVMTNNLEVRQKSQEYALNKRDLSVASERTDLFNVLSLCPVITMLIW